MEADNKQLTRRAATQPHGRAGGRRSGTAWGQKDREKHGAETPGKGRAFQDRLVSPPGSEQGPARPRAPSPGAHPPLRPRPRALASSALSSSIAFLLMVPGGGARSSARRGAAPRQRSPAAAAPRAASQGHLRGDRAAPRPPAAPPPPARSPPPTRTSAAAAAEGKPPSRCSHAPQNSGPRPPLALGRCPVQRLFIKTTGRRRPSWGSRDPAGGGARRGRARAALANGSGPRGGRGGAGERRGQGAEPRKGGSGGRGPEKAGP